MRFARGLYEIEERHLLPHIEAIERVYEVLTSLPPSDEIRFAGSAQRRAAVQRTDPQETSLILFADIYNWLKFFWYTNVFKARMLVEGLIPSYNAQNYLVWSILVRSAVEYAAVFCYFKCKLDRLQLSGPVFKLADLKELEEHLVGYAQGTRFNWDALMAGDVEAMKASKDSSEGRPKAVNILTAVSHLRKVDERFSDIEIAYGLLSDFVHPNMASHTAVVDRLPEERGVHRWRVTTKPGPMRGEFMMYLTLPTAGRALGKIMELAVSLGSVVARWAEMIEESARVVIEFRS